MLTHYQVLGLVFVRSLCKKHYPERTCFHCVCVSGLSVTVLPAGRHHEAGLASESQHQQQPVRLYEGESPADLLSVIHTATNDTTRAKQTSVAYRPLKLSSSVLLYPIILVTSVSAATLTRHICQV